MIFRTGNLEVDFSKRSRHVARRARSRSAHLQTPIPATKTILKIAPNIASLGCFYVPPLSSLVSGPRRAFKPRERSHYRLSYTFSVSRWRVTMGSCPVSSPRHWRLTNPPDIERRPCYFAYKLYGNFLIKLLFMTQETERYPSHYASLASFLFSR